MEGLVPTVWGNAPQSRFTRNQPMRTHLLLPVLVLATPASARKKPDPSDAVPKVPSIEGVIAKEGFVPTPSQSEMVQPGVVLVPNAQGSHDVVHPDCICVEPDISIMSQSSIATSLSAGVSARLSVARGHASAGVEKRLSFVDPEQRTIPSPRCSPPRRAQRASTPPPASPISLRPSSSTTFSSPRSRTPSARRPTPAGA